MFFKKSLKIECDGNIRYKKIADAVYRELGQTDNLLAEIVFSTEEEILLINNEHRSVDIITDVLSFPTLDGIRGKVLNSADYPYSFDGKRLHIGSIAICAKQASRQALEYGNTEEREATYLAVHGLLHLFGYDHETEEDKKQMREIEKRIMSALNMGDN